MKYLCIVTLSVLLISFLSCGDSNQGQTGKDYNIHNPASATKSGRTQGQPVIQFYETEFNFGTLIQGEKVSHSFRFKNKGDGNLILSNVSASCGCTSPSFTREPIPPGGEGMVEVMFDSRGRQGRQNELVRVHSNTQPNITELRVRCDVVN